MVVEAAEDALAVRGVGASIQDVLVPEVVDVTGGHRLGIRVLRDQQEVALVPRLGVVRFHLGPAETEQRVGELELHTGEVRGFDRRPNCLLVDVGWGWHDEESTSERAVFEVGLLALEDVLPGGRQGFVGVRRTENSCCLHGVLILASA